MVRPAFVIAGLLAPALLSAAAGPALAQEAPGRPVHAAGAIDGETLALADGGELRLIGLLVPAEPARRAEEARAELERIAAGRELTLAVGERARDRRGRLLAQAVTADGVWLQGALLAAGLARVETFADNCARAGEMLAIERTARAARRGLWADARFRVLQAAQAETAPEGLQDGFQLVEGRVLEVSERRDRFYLDFGRDWRRDFSVSIRKRDRARFRAAGLDPATLQGAVLRVRGWLRKWNGPLIEATHPEQFERLTP